ncbi:MAG: hypothetical protein ACM3JI_03780 [Anaerolineae bacterium]
MSIQGCFLDKLHSIAANKQERESAFAQLANERRLKHADFNAQKRGFSSPATEKALIAIACIITVLPAVIYLSYWCTKKIHNTLLGETIFPISLMEDKRNLFTTLNNSKDPVISWSKTKKRYSSDYIFKKVCIKTESGYKIDGVVVCSKEAFQDKHYKKERQCRRWTLVMGDHNTNYKDQLLSHNQQIFKMVDELKTGILLIDPIGIEKSLGPTPTPETLVESTEAAMQFLEQDVGAEELITWGKGGGGAITTATHRHHKHQFEKTTYFSVLDRTYANLAELYTTSKVKRFFMDFFGYNFNVFEDSKHVKGVHQLSIAHPFDGVILNNSINLAYKQADQKVPEGQAKISDQHSFALGGISGLADQHEKLFERKKIRSADVPQTEAPDIYYHKRDLKDEEIEYISEYVKNDLKATRKGKKTTETFKLESPKKKKTDADSKNRFAGLTLEQILIELSKKKEKHKKKKTEKTPKK